MFLKQGAERVRHVVARDPVPVFYLDARDILHDLAPGVDARRLLQGDRRVLTLYGVRTYPTTVIVGPDGMIKTTHTGLMLRPQLELATRL